MTTTRTPARRTRLGFPTLRSVLPVALPLLAACATGGGADSRAPDHRIVVEVTNDLIPPRSVTVQFRASDRAARTLGTVGAGETRIFTYQPGLLTGAYRLTARIDEGSQLISEAFTLFPDAQVWWSLRRNELTVGIQG